MENMQRENQREREREREREIEICVYRVPPCHYLHHNQLNNLWNAVKELILNYWDYSHIRCLDQDKYILPLNQTSNQLNDFNAAWIPLSVNAYARSYEHTAPKTISPNLVGRTHRCSRDSSLLPAHGRNWRGAGWVRAPCFWNRFCESQTENYESVLRASVICDLYFCLSFYFFTFWTKTWNTIVLETICMKKYKK